MIQGLYRFTVCFSLYFNNSRVGTEKKCERERAIERVGNTQREREGERRGEREERERETEREREGE